MIFPPFLAVPLVVGAVGVYRYFTDKKPAVEGAVVQPPAPAIPTPTSPIPSSPPAPGAIVPVTSNPGAIVPASQAADSGNGWGKAAVALGVAFLALKLVGAVARAMFPAQAPRVVISSVPGRRRQVRVQRRPGSRGRVQGVWEKRGGNSWSFKPFSRQRRR